MKRKTLLASAMLTTFALNLAAPAVLAADSVEHPTKSSVGFQAPTGPGATDPSEVTPPAIEPPIKPVKPKPGEPEQGGTNGPLGLSVPADLRFGTENKLNLKGDNYFALTTKFTNADHPELILPPMIVVKDIRGLKDGDWDLKATASEFHEYIGDTKGAELKGLRISFKGAQVFNSQDANFSGAGITLGGAGNVTLGTSANSLMSATGGKGNGETTYIGDSRYKINKTNEIYSAGDCVDGIQLNVPSDASAKIKVGSTYKADITWQLSTTAD